MDSWYGGPRARFHNYFTGGLETLRPTCAWFFQAAALRGFCGGKVKIFSQKNCEPSLPCRWAFSTERGAVLPRFAASQTRSRRVRDVTIKPRGGFEKSRQKTASPKSLRQFDAESLRKSRGLADNDTQSFHRNITFYFFFPSASPALAQWKFKEVERGLVIRQRGGGSRVALGDTRVVEKLCVSRYNSVRRRWGH